MTEPATAFAGLDGFLGTRASFMLDFVFLAMFAVVPLLGISVWLVRYRRAFALHKRLQLTLASVLLLAVTAFEVDIRLHGWRDRAMASPYFGSAETPGLVFPVLYVHLTFAISTTLLWIGVTVAALRRFPVPPAPAAHSRAHQFCGRLAALGMVGTAVTGWAFYWLAFVATASTG